MRLVLARRSCSSSRSLCRRPPPTPSRSKGRGPAGGVEGTHVFVAQNGNSILPSTIIGGTVKGLLKRRQSRCLGRSGLALMASPTVFRAPTVRMARRFTPLRGYFTGTRCFSSSAQFTTT